MHVHGILYYIHVLLHIRTHTNVHTIHSDSTPLGSRTQLSIAQIPDVGAKGSFTLHFERRPDGAVVEDRRQNIASMIDNGLGKKAVQTVSCDRPDRCAASSKEHGPNACSAPQVLAGAAQAAKLCMRALTCPADAQMLCQVR